MDAVVADTHTLVWYFESPERLSAVAKQALVNASNLGFPIYASAITLVELTYLVEKRRLSAESVARVEAGIAAPNSAIVIVSVDEPVARALRRIPRNIVPDMPDRIIAATALHLKLPLVTRDEKIHACDIETIW